MKGLFPGISDQEAEQLGSEKEEIYRQLYKKDIHEIAGFTALLEQLKASGIRVALATSSELPNTHFIIDALELQGKFDVVLTGPEVKHPKPNPEMYFTVAEQLELEPGECLVFEDAARGVAAAQAAGMQVIVRGESPLGADTGEVYGYITNFTEVHL